MKTISSASLKTLSCLLRKTAKLMSTHCSIVETYLEISSRVGFRGNKGTN